MLHNRDLKPGVTLGRYEILMPVAQGGMAAVWAARMVGSRGFQKIVAIKTMLPGLSEDPEFEAMFLDEARLAARIRHPHVAEILDLGDENGVLYIVMEWINGESLFVINRNAKDQGGFPLPLLLRMLSSACAGLHAAHEMRDDDGRPLGLVHRDVNPANVMVSYDGIVKIVDFGVAKATASVTITRVPGMMKGKAHYMSPEQIRGERLDRRSDIFSLGILMYVMITGRHPFKATTDKQTMDNIVGTEPVPVHELVPSVRPDLEAVVMRALAKRVEDRWTDCAEMQRALDQITNAIGAAVTDGDVSSFVSKLMGERSSQRRAELAAAIQAADARGLEAAEAPASRRAEGPVSRKRSGTPSSRGGTPSSRGASLEGIIPISLDDGESVPPPPPAIVVPSVPPPPPSAAPALVTSKRKRSVWPWLGLTLVAALGGAGAALRLGHLPWAEPLVPPALRWLLPPPKTAPAPAPPPPPASVVPAPTAMTSASAAPSASAPSDEALALDAGAPSDAGSDAGDAGSDAGDAGSDAGDAGSDALDGGLPDGGGYRFLPPNPGGGWKRIDGLWYPPPWWRPPSRLPGGAPTAPAPKVDPNDPYGD
ncbi:serine/threonine protein kinase [Polyangium jinanense]|uniref:Serine/threonine protein kinase n=1 Tax=Polyangium jinanense TaxID=2829994 RepID=A0A9X3X645_9BACT|nr:serine/threonine-protein kinase [Polyangium jinanense]MDC3957932.1 serine/threonine protein kinase [Polyangium jinanense]MDC3961969.1 serine/threonine protein kinase [Polyangium jinanense]MDC3983485.1 serine/threonine protein kinase [Polyangium jinanense]